MITPGTNQVEEAPDAQLWQRWRQGERVDVGEFLAGFPGLEAAEVVAVLLIDQRERWQLGERIPAENYLRRFPRLESDGEAVVELTYGEFLLREERGERPELDEYLWRFPEHEARLRQQIVLHRALADIGQPEASGDTPPHRSAVLPGVPNIPGYEILGELGRGGMGVVYKARQIKADRVVALKMLLAGGHADAGEMERFRSEAAAIARLQHPNIVQVFEVGEQDGVPFFSLEYCPGGGLDRQLAGKTLSPRAAAMLMERLALAVQAAHEKHIAHRDLKPGNVLLSADGTPRISDFGLARKLDEAGKTQTGAIMGTPSYMAPEQAGGKSSAVGPPADIHALGAILYECLTGRPPFKAATYADTIFQVLNQEPVPPTRHASAVPRDLETICLKCLRKEPENRYASAAELADDLRRFLEDRPIAARRSTVAEHLGRWCRRNPAIAALLAAVFLSLLAGTGVATLFAIRANDNAAQAEKKQAEALAAEREGRRKLFEAYLAEAKATRLSRRAGQRFDTLARVADAAALARAPDLDIPEERLAELRQLAVTALAMPDLAPHYLGEVPENVSIIDLNDDLTRVLLWEPEAYAHVIRSVADGQELFRLPTTARRPTAFFGPGGRHIVRFHEEEGGLAEVWSVAEREPKLIRRDRLRVGNAAFRADASVLALWESQGDVVIWDVRKGTEVNRLPPAPGTMHATGAFHPTQPLLATCGYRSPRVLVRDYLTGRTVQTLQPPWSMDGLGSTSLAWHPDGRRLFVAAGDSAEIQEYLFDPSMHQLRPARHLRLPSAHSGGAAITINSAGDRLATIGWAGLPALLDLETGQALFHARALKSLSRFRFAADNRSLIGIHGFLRGQVSYGVISVGDAREVRTIPLSSPGSRWPALHTNGRLAVVHHWDRFMFVDLAALRELGVVRIGNHMGVGLAIDGEGRFYPNSFEGCFRWPMRFEGEHLTVGPPERLPFHPGRQCIGVSADGRTVAQPEHAGYGMEKYAGGWLLTAQRPEDPLYLAVGDPMGDAVDVSRDGRWVCFGLHGIDRVKVFDGRTGQLVWEVPPILGGYGGRFTPDVRWLVCSHRAFRVGDWGTSVLLDPSGTGLLRDVSPDSRLALIGMSEGYVRLIEIATGRELVRIEPPEGSLGEMKFTPDGTRLLEPCPAGLRVWDLRRIRRCLAEYGLDWDGTAYVPEPEKPSNLPTPLQLTVAGGELLSDLAKLWEYERGLTLFRLAADCFDAQGNLDQARWLMQANKHAEALPHLQLALLSRPESYSVRMNKGLCLMNLGRIEESIREFTAAARARPEDHRPRYHRAQAYKRLGRHAEAADDLTAVLVRFPEDALLYEERAACYAALDDKVKEASDRAATVRLLPHSARGRSSRAWQLVTGPPSDRDPKKALELIRKAIEIEGEEPGFVNTLGVALYRNERWTEAIAALEKSLALGKGKWDAFDLYFLAMCHAQLGDKLKAKDCFDRAVLWQSKQKSLPPENVPELQEFRAEAEQTIREARGKP